MRTQEYNDWTSDDHNKNNVHHLRRAHEHEHDNNNELVNSELIVYLPVGLRHWINGANAPVEKRLRREKHERSQQ